MLGLTGKAHDLDSSESRSNLAFILTVHSLNFVNGLGNLQLQAPYPSTSSLCSQEIYLWAQQKVIGHQARMSSQSLHSSRVMESIAILLFSFFTPLPELCTYQNSLLWALTPAITLYSPRSSTGLFNQAFFLFTYLILTNPKIKISKKKEKKNHLSLPPVPLQSPFWFSHFTAKLLHTFYSSIGHFLLYSIQFCFSATPTPTTCITSAMSLITS